jgi:hypothetical protein
VPDHKLYFADFDKPTPAYFLCGLLHSEIVKEMIEAHNISTNMGDIFKHISLPCFNPKKAAHRKLAADVELAHQQQDPDARAKTVAKVRTAATKLILAEIALRGAGVASMP